MVKRIRMRTLFFGGVITLLFLILIGRIFYVQVVDRDTWYTMAKERWADSETLVANRGTITDRNGNVLAMDALAYNVAVNPKQIDSLGIADKVVEGLNAILNKPQDGLRKIVTAKNDKGEFYAQRELRDGGWNIDKSVADKIKELRDELKKENKVNDVGIYLYDDQKRYYPRNTMASQLLGYVDKDGKALAGIESFFNDKLKGTNGEIKYEKDGKRVQLAEGDVVYEPVVDGQDITLTLDNEIQHYVEEAIKQVADKYQPKSITAIAADPNTMEILAMANYPTFNPNTYWDTNFENAYNHAIKSLYEPGSTFKIVTLAAAVEEGLFNPNAEFQSGSINVPGNPVRDSNRVGWGKISYLDGLKHSSNVAFVKLGWQMLGGEKLVDYINRFGFGQPTGIQLGNESKGVININLSIPSDIARASFGQGPVSVTPIQQIAAVAAVANGGNLMQPQIIKQIYNPNTNTTQKFEPKVVRRVISEETSNKVGEYLEQVVSDQSNGTGKNAYIEGYRVAGKTGTAQKIINGKYSKNKYVVSFIGYAPVENPKVVVYIVVDEPNDPLAGGGTVAAPAFKEIVYKTLRHMGVMPDNALEEAITDKKTPTVKLPDVTEKNLSQAQAELKARNVMFEVVGTGTTVVKQVPAAGENIAPTQRVYLVTEQQDKLTIPDMTGLSLRDALEVASLMNVQLLAEGEGFIISQKEDKQGDKRILRVQLSPPTGAEGAITAEEALENAKEQENAVTEDEASSSSSMQDDVEDTQEIQEQ
ncbi:penicillin-binding transpeptidase domain-containing protein [Paenibacillus sp. KS-LC4]|uniref:penicillin-binding transpeptidase domain-containing protein n=1 Tax=Paenibacillus sp. KS-LC4 TaxID=2979727 RepID=UPI0030D4EEEC